MKIIIISGSNRKDSESIKISKLYSNILKDHSVEPYIFDLSEANLPFWQDDEDGKDSPHKKAFEKYSKLLNEASGILFIVPEWGGMVPPQIKNIFLLASKNELAHKPGLIVAISASSGGAYPVAELRSSSYKNTKICWIPDHVIIRNVEEFNINKNIRLFSRMDYSCKMLIEYANALKKVRKSAELDLFKNGM